MPDDGAISALVTEHGKWLMAFIRGLVGDVTEAEDVFQEVWMRILGSSTEIRSGGARGYLVKTARSVVIDWLRKRRPAESLDAVGGADIGLEIVDDAPPPDARYEAAATATEVRAAVAELPFGMRQVVLMRIEGEMEFREIADELGIPLGTALTWMHAATVRLKRRFGRKT